MSDRCVKHRCRKEGPILARVSAIATEELGIGKPLLREKERAARGRDIGVESAAELRVTFCDARLHIDGGKRDMFAAPSIRTRTDVTCPSFIKHRARADAINCLVKEARKSFEFGTMLKRCQ